MNYHIETIFDLSKSKVMHLWLSLQVIANNYIDKLHAHITPIQRIQASNV